MALADDSSPVFTARAMNAVGAFYADIDKLTAAFRGNGALAALEAECARLVALGAVRVRLLPAGGDNESCLVMQDIEGNEFCLD